MFKSCFIKKYNKINYKFEFKCLGFDYGVASSSYISSAKVNEWSRNQKGFFYIYLYNEYSCNLIIDFQEMEQLTNLKHDMPEMSEMITSFFTGNTPSTATEKQKEKSKAIKSSKKSNKNN